MRFSPAVRVAPDVAPDALHIIKSRLVNNGLMGIFKNRPFAFIDIVAFLILEVLAGFEIDCVTEIFPLFENIHDGGGTPAVNILECLVFIHAFAVPRQMNGGDFYLIGGQLLGDLIRAVAFHRHGKNAAHHSGGKGYSIVVDNSPDTVPDGSITTTSDSYTFSRPSGSSFYIHIAAVDNAGNISSVAHYPVDELVSVTHPVSIGYAIDPNSSTPFTAPDIPITNHSTFPVRVFVAGLKATSGISDAVPTSYSDWNSLTAAQTGSEMALGVGISQTTGSGWTAVDRTTPVYTDDLASEVPLGTLGANGASGNLALTAKFGLAWAKATNVSHELTLKFTISN